jgi:hypothetical protein
MAQYVRVSEKLPRGSEINTEMIPKLFSVNDEIDLHEISQKSKYVKN